MTNKRTVAIFVLDGIIIILKKRLFGMRTHFALKYNDIEYLKFEIKCLGNEKNLSRFRVRLFWIFFPNIFNFDSQKTI